MYNTIKNDTWVWHSYLTDRNKLKLINIVTNLKLENGKNALIYYIP